MAVLRWTPEAYEWLRAIHEYIAADNGGAADRVVEGILARARTLKTFPRLGQVCRSAAEGEIRLLLYGHYRIAYLLRGNDEVDVLGVFHGAMEMDNYLM
jgi:toxin ParE1/3/4